MQRFILTACVAATLAFAASTGVARAQSGPAIAVTGDIPSPVRLTAADLSALPRVTVTASDHGTMRTWSGVWLHEVLKKAGVPLGPQARGTLGGHVVARASDGYEILFSIGEIDPAITEGEILVADRREGAPIPADSGSFRLIIPKDKKGARQLRMLATLHVVIPKR